MCVNRAPVQVIADVWQLSQAMAVGTWSVGLLVVAMRLPGLWQMEHLVGVPLKTPCT